MQLGRCGYLRVSDVGLLEAKSHRSDEPLVLGRLPCKPLPHIRNLGYHPLPRLLCKQQTKKKVTAKVLGNAHFASFPSATL